MIEFLNMIIAAFANAITAVLGILPDSPFTWDLGGLSDIWMYGSYFVPWAHLVTIMEAYVVCVLVWYIVRWALRFIRFIG